MTLPEEPDPRDVETALLDAMRNSVRRVKRDSFWPFRLLDRFFVTRHRMFGKSIEEQFRMGSIRETRQ